MVGRSWADVPMISRCRRRGNEQYESSGRRREGACGAEGVGRETLADDPVGDRVGVQMVGQGVVDGDGGDNVECAAIPDGIGVLACGGLGPAVSSRSAGCPCTGGFSPRRPRRRRPPGRRRRRRSRPRPSCRGRPDRTVAHLVAERGEPAGVVGEQRAERLCVPEGLTAGRGEPK